jgi:hypothetical protein
MQEIEHCFSASVEKRGEQFVNRLRVTQIKRQKCMNRRQEIYFLRGTEMAVGVGYSLSLQKRLQQE